MATTIHSLAYKVNMDTSNFTKGAAATRQELREAKKVTDQYRTSTDKLEDEIQKLTNLHQKGLISQKQYAGEVRKANQAHREQTTYIGKASAAMRKHANVLKLVGSYLTVAAAKKFVGAMAQNISDMDLVIKKARQIGVEASDLVRIQHAASLNTVMSNEDVVKSIEQLVKRIGEARQGSGEAGVAIEQLGLSLETMSKASALENVLMISDAFQGISDEQTKMALAADLFGKSGLDMVNLLNAGRDAITEAAKEADHLGITWDDINNNKIEAANDALNNMHKAIKAAGIELAITFAPVLEDAANYVKDVAIGLRKIADGSIFDVKKPGEAAGFYADVGVDAMTQLSQFQQYKQRYTGEFSPVTQAERDRILSGRDNVQRADIANEMLKELRRIRGISEDQALTYDARKRELN